MPFYVQVDENLEIQNNYEDTHSRRVGDIELNERINLAKVDVVKDEHGQIKFTSNVEKEQRMFNIEMNTLREMRSEILNKTDYLATIDYPHPTEEAKQAWLDYRQALRDLPANTTDPENPVWPTPPE